MTDRILPRSPHETMNGWVFLPRYVDQIRLHLAGKLPPDDAEHLGWNSDALWLRAAGVDHETMVAVVRARLTDGEGRL
jgi:hypothetical protein